MFGCINAPPGRLYASMLVVACFMNGYMSTEIWPQDLSSS
jgi:hypothetical protein